MWQLRHISPHGRYQGWKGSPAATKAVEQGRMVGAEGFTGRFKLLPPIISKRLQLVVLFFQPHSPLLHRPTAASLQI
jgi:hypothetical protein